MHRLRFARIQGEEVQRMANNKKINSPFDNTGEPHEERWEDCNGNKKVVLAVTADAKAEEFRRYISGKVYVGPKKNKA